MVTSKIVLIGGQAVALWGAQLADYLPIEEEPVASRDFDFQGSRSDVRLAAGFKNTPLSWRQLRACIRLVPAFSRFLLDSGESPRLVMKLNERVFELAYHNRDAMRIYLEESIDVFDAALVDQRLPERHLAIRLPQMREALKEKRDRRRAGRSS